MRDTYNHQTILIKSQNAQSNVLEFFLQKSTNWNCWFLKKCRWKIILNSIIQYSYIYYDNSWFVTFNLANPLGVLVSNGIAAGMVSSKDDIKMLVVIKFKNLIYYNSVKITEKTSLIEFQEQQKIH